MSRPVYPSSPPLRGRQVHVILVPLSLLPVRTFDGSIQFGKIPLPLGLYRPGCCPPPPRQTQDPERDKTYSSTTEPRLRTRPRYFHTHTALGSQSLVFQAISNIFHGLFPLALATDKNVYGAWPRVSSTDKCEPGRKRERRISTSGGRSPSKYRAESQTRQFWIKKEKNKSEAPSRLTLGPMIMGLRGEPEEVSSGEDVVGVGEDDGTLKLAPREIMVSRDRKMPSLTHPGSVGGVKLGPLVASV